MSIDTTTAANTAAPTALTSELRQAALDHLWQHNRDWESAARDNEPLIFVSGEGIRVTDSDGETWIDVNGGYSSVNIGYGRTEIAEAAFEQLKQIPYFPQGSANPPTIRLAAKLAELAPGTLNRVFPVSGGSLANETALKVARAYHHRRGHDGRFRLISRRGSYHGATGGVLFLGSVPSSPRTDYEPAPPGMVYAPQPNAYRCELHSSSPEECAVKCAEAIETLIEFHGADTVAAVIAEPLASGPGAVMPDPVYWQMLREICTRHDVLLIADEVITGFGRTGKLFAMEHFGVVPDIMTLAKGLAGGVACGAIIATPEVALSLKPGTHASTFGGNPLAMAAGLAAGQMIEEQNLLANCRTMSDRFRSHFQTLQNELSIISELRICGLMIGIDLTIPATPAVGKCMQRGLLVNATQDTVLRLLPAINVEAEQVDEGCAIIADVLSEMAAEVS